jgi:hypothetical protein
MVMTVVNIATLHEKEVIKTSTAQPTAIKSLKGSGWEGRKLPHTEHKEPSCSLGQSKEVSGAAVFVYTVHIPLKVIFTICRILKGLLH